MAFPFRLCLALMGLLSLLPPATSRVLERQQSANSIGALGDAIPNQGTGVPTSSSTDLENIGTDPSSKSPIVRTAGTDIVVEATSGQQFFISLENSVETLGDDAEVATSPAVNWVSLDHKEKAITGLVPTNYPAGRVAISLTVRLTVAGSVVEIGFSFVLDIHQPESISISTANTIPTSTAGSISSGISLLPTTPTTTASSPATTTSAIFLPTATAGQLYVADPLLRNDSDRVNSLYASPASPWLGLHYFGIQRRVLYGLVPSDLPNTTVSIDITATTPSGEFYNVTRIIPIRDASGASTTTTSTASRTIQTSLPTTTVTQGQSFGIGFDPFYRYSPGDIVNLASTDPPVDWIRLDQPPPFRAQGLLGDVPATQPPGPIAVTLSIYGRGPVVQGTYTITFTIVVVAATTNTPP